MLKRLEVYADAGLLSFAFSVVLLLALSIVGRALGMLLGGGQAAMMASMITIVGVSIVGGAVLAIWLSRVFHRPMTKEPMSTKESQKMAWAGLGAAAFAVVLGVVYSTVGTTTPAIWLTVAVALLALAAAMVVDAVRDLMKAREHIPIDILRILMVGLLAASLVTAMSQPAQLGSDQDVSPWVIWVTIAMLAEALIAFAVDEFVSWRAHKRDMPAHVVPVA